MVVVVANAKSNSTTGWGGRQREKKTMTPNASDGTQSSGDCDNEKEKGVRRNEKVGMTAMAAVGVLQKVTGFALKVALSSMGIVGAVALDAAVLGAARLHCSASAWRVLQAGILSISAVQSPVRFLARRALRTMALGLVYATAAKRFWPAHWRDLQFWSSVAPIYVRYKLTQIQARRISSEKLRDRLWASRHEWGAVKVYELCTRLRGFYLKDGQFIGSRADFVPAAWVDKLSELQDRVPPVPLQQIETTLCESFGVNHWQQLFAQFSERPLASATIAQVHEAKLRDGRRVVLKAQYRDQERLCKLDLQNLRALSEFLQATDFKFFDLISVVSEFEQQLPLEFDFAREAAMMGVIGNNLRRAGLCPSRVVVPAAVHGLVSRRAFVQEFIDGVRLDDNRKLREWNVRPRSVLQAIGDAFGQMLLVDGVMHADPHLGNVLVLPDGRVALIDFGQVKTIPDELRRGLCAFYLAMANNDIVRTGQTLFALGIRLEIDVNAPDAMETAALYANGLLDTRPIPDDVEINPFSSKSPLKTAPITKFPPELFMVLRTMGLLRSLCLAANVEFCMSAAFRRYAVAGLDKQPIHKTLFPPLSRTQRVLETVRRFSSTLR